MACNTVATPRALYSSSPSYRARISCIGHLIISELECVHYWMACSCMSQSYSFTAGREYLVAIAIVARASDNYQKVV